MKDTESLEDFYKRKFDMLPENFRSEIGHFNIFRLEPLDRIREGIYCIFDQHFFNQFGNFQHYEVFQPQGNHIFELNDEQTRQINQIYERMVREFESDYKYKYDLIRNLIFELLHFALKLEPSAQVEDRARNASQRISSLFMELLERQFPIDETHQRVQFRSASEFAE